MSKRYLKAIDFGNFIIATEDVSNEELGRLNREGISEIESDVPTSLGYNEKSKNFFIYEWRNYELKASNERPFTDNDNFFSGKLNKLTNSGVLKLENFIGVIQFREVIFEVHSEKIDYHKVIELTNYLDGKITSLSLAFNQHARSRTAFKKNAKDSKDFNQFIFLYNLLKSGKLMLALNTVLRNPYHSFQSINENIDFAQLKSFSGETLIDIFTGTTSLQRTHSNLRIAQKLNGYVPIKVNQYEKYVSNDNNENQFVLFFLKKCLSILNYQIRFLTSNLEQRDKKKSIVDLNFIHELIRYRTAITRQTKSRFFQDVSQLKMINRSSTVLTRRQGYKQLYNFYLNLKSIPFNFVNNEDFTELFHNKSIDKLYEYVALFYLDDYLKACYEIESFDFKISILDPEKNYSINLDESNDKIYFKYQRDNYPTTTLFFQRSYTRKADATYAITQQPDFTLLVETEGREYLYHFDTKFKFKIFDTDNENITDQLRFVKEEDLKSMHAYHDGINKTIGAYVLYPGNEYAEKRIFTATSELMRKNIHEESINPYNGIGSIPLQIESSNRSIKHFINEIIDWHRNN